MLKMAPTSNELPVQDTFVPLNIDGQACPAIGISVWLITPAARSAAIFRCSLGCRSHLGKRASGSGASLARTRPTAFSRLVRRFL